MRKLACLLLHVLWVSVGTGCASLPEDMAGFSPRVPTLEEKQVFEEERPTLGLALSGGGIRSALMSIGVMKALYDARYLDHVDMISSVSGGGFASYWLVGEEHLRGQPEQPFGFTRFDSTPLDPQDALQTRYAKNLCQVVRGARFMGKGIYTPARYEKNIRKSFGSEMPIAIHELQQSVISGKIPYPVWNASRRKPRPHDQGYQDSIFEFTPFHFGSDRERHTWTTKSAELWRPVYHSGSAAWSERFDQGEYIDGLGKVRLSDGGHIENFGIMAHLKRQTKHIIVVDAVEDPGYKFGPYHKLACYVREGKAIEGMTFKDSDVPDGTRGKSDKAFYSWTVQYDNERTSQVYYIKLAVPQTLEDRLERYRASTSYRSKVNISHVGALLKASSGKGQCDTARDINHPELYMEAYLYYWDYLTKNKPFTFGSKLKFLNYAFPQQTTLDQQMYSDQALALIALGYLLADELVQSGRLDRAIGIENDL